MYDFIIIGGGTTGLSAAMYASRLGLKTLTLATMPGGLITTTHLVENWPGIKGISGPDLAMNMYSHAESTGAEIKGETVLSITKNGDDKSMIFTVKTASNEYTGKSVLIATGTEHRKLGIPGEKEFENKGVSFCALCDGAFYKEKKVCIVGGGDGAAKEALFLTEHASEVYLVVRGDKLRAEPTNIDKVNAHKKITVLFKTELEEILGDDKVTAVKFKEKEGGLKSGETIDMDGVFLAVGHLPQTELAAELGVELTPRGEIKIDRRSMTNISGVFAAGDCTDTEFKQAITGSAEGVTAAYHAYHIASK